MTYTPNLSEDEEIVSVSGNTLTIFGSALTGDTTVTVYANGTAVTSFVCKPAG